MAVILKPGVSMLGATAVESQEGRKLTVTIQTPHAKCKQLVIVGIYAPGSEHNGLTKQDLIAHDEYYTRQAFFAELVIESKAGSETVVAGDFNCVGDVAYDVHRAPNVAPRPERNVGGAVWAATAAAALLRDSKPDHTTPDYTWARNWANPASTRKRLDRIEISPGLTMGRKNQSSRRDGRRGAQ